MEREQLEATVLEVLGRIAPEADLARLKRNVNLRHQLDLDSMDFLNFAIGLHKALGVDIPEVDYPRLTTIAGCVEYLAAVRPGPPG